VILPESASESTERSSGRTLLPETFRKNYFFQKVSEEILRKIFERPVLPEDLSILPEKPFFQKSSGTPSRSSRRTLNGSSRSRHRNHSFPHFSRRLLP